MHSSLTILVIALLLAIRADAQQHESTVSTTPTVTFKKAPPNPYRTTQYPWRRNITATIFWIGEKPTARNPTPNHASSWDTKWQKNYGGYDNPDPTARIYYRPKAFKPQLNPFYIALPFNDSLNYKTSHPVAHRVIPWWQKRPDKRPGKTSLKGRWVQIYFKGKSCFAQWEDCGPFNTDDWQYVFGGNPPKNKKNNSAGIDLSPSVRDYLGLKSSDKVHWRFIDFKDVPRGPWAHYGKNNPFLHPDQDPDHQAKKQYMLYLKQLRDQSYKQKNSRGY